MAGPVPAGNYNWAAYTIQEKHGWVDGKLGARAVEPATTAMNRISDASTTANNTLSRRLDGLAVEWRGPASDASQARLRAVGDGMGASSAVMSNGSRELDDYGHSFSNMAPQIVYDDPARAGWWGFLRNDGWQAALGILDSRLSFSQANQQNSQQADHALTVHSANAADVASRFGADAGPGARWPEDGQAGDSRAGGGAASFGGATPGGAPSTPGGAGAGADRVPGAGGGAGPPDAATVPARVDPPTSHVAGPQAGGPQPGTQPSAAPQPGALQPGTPQPGAPQAPTLGGPGSPSAGVPPPGAWSSGGPMPVGQAGGTPSSRPQPSVLRADPGALSNSERAARFQEGMRSRQMPVPGPFGAGSGAGARGGVPDGRGGTGGWAGAGGGSGGGISAWGGAGSGSGGAGGGRGPTGANPGTGPLSEGGNTGARGTGVRPGLGEGPGPAGARVGERGAGGYGPMTGGAGAGPAGGHEHRNRYLVLSDEAFTLPLVATDPVVGPEDDDRG